jgi:hypothetical protein
MYVYLVCHSPLTLYFFIPYVASNETVFSVSKDPDAPVPNFPKNFDYDQLRSISYNFSALFLEYETVRTTLAFAVGPQEVKNFRMIERHYFKDQLVKSYDFNFPFCIPNSTNEWDSTYDLPPLSSATIQDMINNPNMTTSDSFYFVDGELIMHNKASYSYYVGDAEEAKQQN